MRRAQEKLFKGRALYAEHIGEIGEHTAEVFLAANGYTVVARNAAFRYGEIDRVVSDGRYLVFVEVKTRAKGAQVAGEEAVDARKQEKLRAAAALWLQQNPTELQPRFDVIVVEHDERDVRVTRHIQNAF